MTREETIQELGEWLEQMIQHGVPSHSAKRKALATAIALLSAEAVQGWIPVGERLPEDSGNYLITVADLQSGHIGEHTVLMKKVLQTPTIDAVEVVRCKDCIRTMERDKYTGRLWCPMHRGYMEDTYYCADGLRIEDVE